MNDDRLASETAHELRAWLTRWAGYVRARDFASARELFDLGVVGFGTRMHVVRGLDRLEADQWRHVWPTIEDFQFLVDEMHSDVSPCGVQAWCVVPWTSIGYHPDGTSFERPGRATVIFKRASNGGPTAWRAVHTHISLAPGTPQRSWGRPVMDAAGD